ncbi:hypothetical protein J2W97_001271 [Paenibacillus jamilae]|uniref:Uncharacterized protein n=1 Tax=Paenibacillus polymyxa TaxID=1406 RepID=A0A378XZI1_PAEPO|nr:hypothetical protein [Paenibacillus polymyxa]MDP9675288.1 hypothetical protein [Paenibacillus jamilae]UOD84499.1 hypothetical protein CUU60_04500 [Paenibacillus polymyxa ATCC 842]SUA70244.1 Uncharacterised protein [Paenibacillus polymyxa]
MVNFFTGTLLFIIDFINVLVIYCVIGLLWTIAEKIFYGTITPRTIDDIVAFILACSIYLNLIK